MLIAMTVGDRREPFMARRKTDKLPFQLPLGSRTVASSSFGINVIAGPGKILQERRISLMTYEVSAGSWRLQ